MEYDFAVNDDLRKYIKNFLNNEIKESELMLMFGIEQCRCGNYFLEDDMIDTEGMINGGIGKVCEDCVDEL
ncbi:MAG: hypothetical protein RR478_04800 [Bacilli bacterium]